MSAKPHQVLYYSDRNASPIVASVAREHPIDSEDPGAPRLDLEVETGGKPWEFKSVPKEGVYLKGPSYGPVPSRESPR